MTSRVPALIMPGGIRGEMSERREFGTGHRSL
jgi:hypothetical protein